MTHGPVPHGFFSPFKRKVNKGMEKKTPWDRRHHESNRRKASKIPIMNPAALGRNEKEKTTRRVLDWDVFSLLGSTNPFMKTEIIRKSMNGLVVRPSRKQKTNTGRMRLRPGFSL